MNTTPEQPQHPSQQGPSTQGRAPSGAASAVAIVTAIVGGIALISVGATSAIAATGSIIGQTQGASSGAPQPVDVSGITELTVDASAGEFELRFAKTDQATLEVTGTAPQNWRMDRSGDELTVHTGREWFNFGVCLFGCNFADQQVVLTLPIDLQGKLDADLSLGAGSLTAEGDFRDLDLEVSAGMATATGSARTLSASLSAGRANLNLANVTEASLEVSAGKISAELTGAAPRSVDIDVSAGALDLQLADVPYRVDSEVAAGQLNNGLQVNPSSQNLIEVSLAAGQVRLQPGR